MASNGDAPGTGQAVQSPPNAQMAETQPLEIPKADSSKAATSASRRVRARLARRMTAQRSAVNPVLEPLVAVHKQFYPKADLTLLQRAYEVADERHADQLRRSGDPYITHPLAVANILAELEMDTTTLIAALLHDTVEDTGYTLEALTEEFGTEVGHLVDGVTKLDKVALGTAAEGETIRKMILAMARDPRVLVIKVADRLHNMRTMRFLPPEKQAAKSRETLEVIAPLAHRLGMASVKWELEDLSFAILHPKKYEEIGRLVADRAPSRDIYLAKVRAEITATLTASKINAVVEGRPKHYWSIYQKMIVKGRDFDDIHDLVGVRILCDEVRDCYAAVGVVHSLWQPIAGRFKDYIAQPRFGVYQSLHTTVVGPEGKPLEVQIRTTDMHKTAEYGIAAHWRYKEAKGRNGLSATSGAAEIDDMAWMRQLLDWQREAADPGEFLESLRYDLAVQEIFVFTPKGDLITLPTGSTPVDFAYAVHTEVGHRCIGSRVNGRLVALERKLENGDQVEVFTSKAPNAGPSRDWQTFVVSPRAKAKIRQWFAKERREEALETGKDAIAREVRRAGIPLQRLMNAEQVAALARELRYADVSALYTAVGEGHVSARHVGEGSKRSRYTSTACAASLMLKCPANAKPTPSCAAMLAPALVEPSIQIGGMGASLGIASTSANGCPGGNVFVANAISSASRSFTSFSRVRRSAAEVTGSVPGARPRPRSMRPGCSASRVRKISRTRSGVWFGSMIPPAPTRIRFVTCAM